MPNHKIDRIEIYSSPDGLGRYSYMIFWTADYHPGDPEGEHRTAERGQMFKAPIRFECDNIVDKRKSNA